MAEKETKKAVAKKPAPKKAPSSKVEAKEAEVVETPKEAPKRAKRVEIDRNEMIPCRSVTDGVLIHISDRTRARFLWSDYGVVQYVEMGELLDMRASHPKFLNDIQLVVEDDDAVEYLGLTEKYKSIVGFDDLEEFFEKDYDEISVILDKVPVGIKQSIASRARKMIEDGTLDSNNKIKLIEEKLKVDLKMFVE